MLWFDHTMVLLQVLVLLLASFARTSRAVYCICKDGASSQAMQNNIDYACGSGADCSGILQSGPCYLPNTVKDHCNYAVNSYFQRKGQVNGSCDFSGSATASAVIPNQVAGCVYQASPSSTTFTPTPPTSSGMTPMFGTPPPPSAIFTPALGPMSGTVFNNSATAATSWKGTLFVVLLIVPWIGANLLYEAKG